MRLLQRKFERIDEISIRFPIDLFDDTMLFFSGVEEHSPGVYELDTTDLANWQENVEERAEKIIEAFLHVRCSSSKRIEVKLFDV